MRTVPHSRGVLAANRSPLYVNVTPAPDNLFEVFEVDNETAIRANTSLQTPACSIAPIIDGDDDVNIDFDIDVDVGINIPYKRLDTDNLHER